MILSAEKLTEPIKRPQLLNHHNPQIFWINPNPQLSTYKPQALAKYGGWIENIHTKGEHIQDSKSRYTDLMSIYRPDPDQKTSKNTFTET